MRRAALAPVVAACGLAAGCATTVGVQQNDPRETYDQIAVSAVGVDDYSRFSEDVPTRYDKVQAFAEAPLQGLAFLHHEAEKDSRNDSPFALAELNYFIAVRQRQGGVEKSRPHFLASAIYASLYLLSQDWMAPPSPFDRRFRIACDLYNNSLAQALTNSDGNLQFAPAKVDLPVGRFAFSVDASQFHQSFDQFEKFLSADNFGVSGLSRRNREAGMGAAIIAVEQTRRKLPCSGPAPEPFSWGLPALCRISTQAPATAPWNCTPSTIKPKSRSATKASAGESTVAGKGASMPTTPG